MHSLLGVLWQHLISLLFSTKNPTSFNQYTAKITGETSKNQNYFLISAVILGNILTCFTKPYNYTDSLFKTLIFTAICVLHPSNPDVNARPIPWPINEDPDKEEQETTKAQQPSRGRRSRRTDNLSSVVAQQSGKCPSAPSREPSPTSKGRGTGSWAHAGRLEPSSGASFGIKLLQHAASGTGTKASHTTCFHSKDTEPVPGSGQPQALTPYLLEVTLGGSAGCRLTGDDAVLASAVLARIRLPERVILQIKLGMRLVRHEARPV